MIDLCQVKSEGEGRLNLKIRCRDRNSIILLQIYRVLLEFMGLKVAKGCREQAAPKTF